MMSNKEPSAMDCWHFIAPLIPITDDFSQSVYVKTFQAFKLLEDEKKKKNGINSDQWNDRLLHWISGMYFLIAGKDEDGWGMMRKAQQYI